MNQASEIARFKAPKGTMYNVFDIHFTILAGGNNSYMVVDYHAEDISRFSNIIGLTVLAVINATIGGQSQDFNFTKGEKTKFLSIGRESAVASTVFVVIHYELVPASKVDLIWEWFRKGR